jgi:hypothetical protein
LNHSIKKNIGEKKMSLGEDDDKKLLLGLIAIDYEPIELYYPSEQKKIVSIIGIIQN